MQSTCVEGWAKMDGLLSGPTPRNPMDAQALVEAVEQAAQAGLRASLDVDGGRFHLLVDDAPFPAVEPELAATLSSSLDRVLSSGKVEVERCESTVRLRSWTRGEEHQTLFVPAAGGFQAMTRSVECATVEAPTTGSRRAGRWLQWSAVLLGAIAAWFILQRDAPANWGMVEIDTGPYADLLRIESTDSALNIQRGMEPEQLRELIQSAPLGSLRAWVVEDLLRGRLRFRFVGGDGQTLGQAWHGVVFDGAQAKVALRPPPGTVRIEFIP